ncbi:alpha-ketoglutarate-dependent dioxygenase alkB 3-like protein [Camelus ferus]|nr:alpha-ketoglutarate-dependent dioxygenase alkB 3-like protein [Camelus ferus]
MEDKRQRARVQGAWAGRAKSQAIAQPGKNLWDLVCVHVCVRVDLDRYHPPFVYLFALYSGHPFQWMLPLLRTISNRDLVRPGLTRSIICLEDSLCSENPRRVCLYPGFVDLKEANWVLEQLCRDVPWKQRTGIREDVTYQQPRLTAWYGELPYTYSRVTMEPNPHWHPVLLTLKNQIEANTGHTFNSLLCNLYRNEKDSVDWHSDDEPSLGRCPIIASLSFGATRIFEMRKKPPPVSIPYIYFMFFLPPDIL